MSFKHFSFLLLILIVLTLSFSFLRILTFPDPAWSLDKGERVTVSSNSSLTQIFTATRSNLRQVEILFGKFTLEENDALILELRDPTCSSILTTETLSKRDFDSEHPYTFVFDPIKDSENQTYCFVAVFDTERTIPKDKAPRFFTDLSKEGTSYSLIEGSEITPGTDPIAIRPGYVNSSIFTTLQELTNRISQYKPTFLKGGWILFFASTGLFFTFLVAVLLIRAEGKE